MKIGGTFLRFLFALGLTLAGIAAPLLASSASAQGAQTYQSPMTGMTINATAPWTIETDTVLSQDGIESITVMGQYEFMQIWFMPGDVDLTEARDVILDSYATTFGTFVEIDRGAYGNVSYSLDMTNSEGIEFGVFSLFLGQRESGFVEYYVYFGAVPAFASGFASAQQNVTVGGTPVFGGVDGAGLQNLLVANAGATGASTQTQAPPPTQPPAPQADTPPTQPPAQPSGDEGAAYISALQGETAYLQQTVIDFLANYTSLDGANGEAAIAELNRVAGEWDAYPERAAGIVAPPGYEDIDASYRTMVTEVDALAGLWNGVIQAAQNQDGTFTTKLTDLILRVMGLQTQIDDLNLMLNGQGTTDTPAPTEATTAAPTVPSGQTTTGTSPESSAYVDSIRAETTRLRTSLDDFLTKFGQLGDGTAANPEQTAQELSDILLMWASMPETATQFVAPVGMEDVDAAYVQLANDFAAASESFGTALSLQSSGDQAGSQTAFQTFSTQIDGLYADLASLDTLLDQKAQSTTTTTTDAPTAVPTEATQVTTSPTEEPAAGSADGDAYLATIASEVAGLEESLGLFTEGLEMLGSEDAQEQEAGSQQVSDTLNYWATYPDVASAIVAPAGYEDIDAAYREVANTMPELTNAFIEYIETEDAALKEAAVTEFGALVDDVEVQLADLNTLLDATGTGVATSQPDETPEQDPTEEPVAEQPTEDVEANTTETGGRGQLPPDPEDEPEDEPNGSSGTSGEDFEDVGLVADDEYVSPQFDVDVLWDDRWEFDPDGAEEPIYSDTDEGLDSITLMWTGGNEGDITVLLGNQTGFTPDENVEYWQSDEYFDQLGASGDVLLAEAGSDRGAVLIMLDAGDDGVVLYREAVCLDRDCTQWAIVTIFAPVDDAQDIIADAEEGIEVGGDSATDVFSQREIRQALEN